MAPIFTSLSRNVVIDQCSTSFGKASVLMKLPNYRPDTDTFYQSYLVATAHRAWRVTIFSNIPGTTGGTMTSAAYLGQQEDADAAANSILAADYDATIRYHYYNLEEARIEYLSAYGAPVGQVAAWDVEHVMTRGDQFPHQLGDAYSGATHATDFTDSDIDLPAGGWIWAVGFIGGDHAFSLRIPVSLITDKTATSAGEDHIDANSIRFGIGNNASDAVIFGHTTAGRLLFGTEQLTAFSLSVYV